MIERALCPACEPERFPVGYGAAERTNPAHFSVRFGRDKLLNAYLDGELFRRAEELQCGPLGWIVAWPLEDSDLATWACPRCHEATRDIYLGNVSVENPRQAREGGSL